MYVKNPHRIITQVCRFLSALLRIRASVNSLFWFSGLLFYFGSLTLLVLATGREADNVSNELVNRAEHLTAKEPDISPGSRRRPEHS